MFNNLECLNHEDGTERFSEALATNHLRRITSQKGERLNVQTILMLNLVVHIVTAAVKGVWNK
jgi:hypothetical protein